MTRPVFHFRLTHFCISVVGRGFNKQRRRERARTARAPLRVKEEKKNMNKGQLADAIAEQANLSKSSAQGVVDAFVGAVTSALKSGDKVTLTGFGTFSVSQRAARKARNPRTGEEIMVAAATVPKFKAGAGLKASVN